MTDRQWERMWELFHEIAELPVDRRAERLKELSLEDPALRSRVGRLLEAHDRASSILDQVNAAGPPLPLISFDDDEREPS